jgi:hypothetical protein
MPKITLTCVELAFQGQTWQLDLHADRTVLTDPNGATAASFARQEADRKLILPNAWEKIENLGVVTDGGEVRWFAPEPDKVQPVKDYLESARSAGGPEAAQALATKGRLSLLLGIGAVILGAGMLVATAMNPPEEPPTLRYILLAILVGYGLVEAVRGALALGKSGQV